MQSSFTSPPGKGHSKLVTNNDEINPIRPSQIVSYFNIMIELGYFFLYQWEIEMHLDLSSLKKCIYLDVSPLKKMFQCHSLAEKLFKSEARVSIVWLNYIIPERTWGVPIANSRGIGDQVFQVIDIQSPE